MKEKNPSAWHRLFARVIDIVPGLVLLNIYAGSVTSDEYQHQGNFIITAIVILAYRPFMDANGGSFGKRLLGMKMVYAPGKTKIFYRYWVVNWPLLILILGSLISFLAVDFLGLDGDSVRLGLTLLSYATPILFLINSVIIFLEIGKSVHGRTGYDFKAGTMVVFEVPKYYNDEQVAPVKDIEPDPVDSRIAAAEGNMNSSDVAAGAKKRFGVGPWPMLYALAVVLFLHILLVNNKKYAVDAESTMYDSRDVIDAINHPRNYRDKREPIDIHTYYFGVLPESSINCVYLGYFLISIGSIMFYKNDPVHWRLAFSNKQKS